MQEPNNMINASQKGAVPRISAVTLAKIGILTALSYILYMFVKFPLPFLFPFFLDIQISELPALLGGFAMGPIAGCIIILVKCLLKMPFSGSACVGELGDILLGIAFVLPASLIYKFTKSKKGAFLGLLAGLISSTVVAVIVNRFLLIPYYVMVGLEGGWEQLLGIVKPLYPDVTQKTFYAYYLPLAVVPFNIIRGILSAGITFAVYKPLSKALHWEGKTKTHYKTYSAKQTVNFGKRFAQRLQGGETVVLCGELGAGKTQITKGIALGLGIADEITSPTFAIHNVYYGRLTLNHFDFYRLDEQEGLALGFEEIIGAENAVSVIEWAENVTPLLPTHYCKITVDKLTETARQIIIEEV